MRKKTEGGLSLNRTFISFMCSTAVHAYTHIHMLPVNNAAGAQCAIHTDRSKLTHTHTHTQIFTLVRNVAAFLTSSHLSACLFTSAHHSCHNSVALLVNEAVKTFNTNINE